MVTVMTRLDLIHAASGHTIECSTDKAIADAAKYWNKEVEKIIDYSKVKE